MPQFFQLFWFTGMFWSKYVQIEVTNATIAEVPLEELQHNNRGLHWQHKLHFPQNMLPKYYTPNEVSVHNTLEDLWVSFLGNVYDLTPLVQKHKGECFKVRLKNCSGRPVSWSREKQESEIHVHFFQLYRYDNGLWFAGDILLKPIIAEGGKDISHWFNTKTKDVSRLFPYCMGIWWSLGMEKKMFQASVFGSTEVEISIFMCSTHPPWVSSPPPQLCIPLSSQTAACECSRLQMIWPILVHHFVCTYMCHFYPGAKSCGPDDRVQDSVHTSRAVHPHSTSTTQVRLGQWFWSTLVERRQLLRGCLVQEDEANKNHQHLDFTRAHSGGNAPLSGARNSEICRQSNCLLAGFSLNKTFVLALNEPACHMQLSAPS